MEGFKIQKWESGYPGFHIAFGSAKQLSTFIAMIKKYDSESNLCDAYDLCVNMPSDQASNTLHKETEDFEYDISAERAENTLFHVMVSDWLSSDCLVINLNGTIKGDYHFFGRFDEEGYFPAKLGEILLTVAQEDPQYEFKGIIYCDDGDHFSDTAEFSYKGKKIEINYKDDSGYWESRPVTICL